MRNGDKRTMLEHRNDNESTRRAKTLRLRLAAGILALLVSVAGAFILPTDAFGQEEATTDPILDELTPLIRVIQYLQRYYYRDVSLPDLIQGGIDGLLGSLDDPQTQFFEPNEYEDFQDDIDGIYNGVGIVIEARNGQIVVVSPLRDSPAERAGVLGGDIIVEVDGRPIAGERIDVVTNLIRGPEGTEVTLTLQRGADRLQVTLRRQQIRRETVSAKMVADDIGYIRIEQFRQGTGDAVGAAYAQMQRLQLAGVILDLRNNPGGILSEAIAVADVFLDEGAPIVHVRTRDGGTRSYRAEASPEGPPVVVLVNQGSASASEIVAAALQENGVAVVIGTRTYGKGTVQSIVEFGDGSALKLTTAEYLTPKRNTIEGSGLQPDINVDPREASPAAIDWLPLTGRHVLQRGQRGLEVEALQQRLNRLGYEAGPQDGIFGPQTERALRAFQADQGLPVTGRVDQAVKNALDHAILTLTEAMRDDDPVLQRAIEWLRDRHARANAG